MILRTCAPENGFEIVSKGLPEVTDVIKENLPKPETFRLIGISYSDDLSAFELFYEAKSVNRGMQRGMIVGKLDTETCKVINAEHK